MEISFHINQVQSQKQRLVLSVQMKESLDILQMPLLKLQEKVKAELIENPVLEYRESRSAFKPVSKIESERLRKIQNLFSETCGREDSSSGFMNIRENGDDPFATLSAELTFEDFLQRQLMELNLEPSLAKICRYVIDSLDEKGYLHDSAQTIAADLNIAEINRIEEAISIVRKLEPAGIGASSLRECLALQVQRLSNVNPAVAKIIDRHLELVAGNKIKEIAKEFHLSLMVARECCNIIRNLNPIPSNGFNTRQNKEFVLPEVAVKVDECGNLYIESDCDPVQRLSVNTYYVKMARKTDDFETQKYLEGKINRAVRLINDIGMRKKTIFRIVDVVVKLQPLYFKKGKSFLKPMTMKRVAELLNLNESTISRAVQNKFILCPWGTVSLKSLFTSPLRTVCGSDFASTNAVKEQIQSMIRLESKEHPLSDQKITNRLQKEKGIAVSRRVVAKWRKELAIPTSAQRKIQK